MKKIISLTVFAFALSAQADPLHTYVCVAAHDGSRTPNEFTAQANKESIVVSPQRALVPQTSFKKVDTHSALIQDLAKHEHGGAAYKVVKNNNSFFASLDMPYYEVQSAFATHGVRQGKSSGRIWVIYKATEAYKPYTNDHQWSREYGCIETHEFNSHHHSHR
jgi:hypothetical protein